MSIFLAHNSKMLKADSVRPGRYFGWIKNNPIPTTLPAFTLRLKFPVGYTPTFSKGTGVQQSSDPNIWDLTYENTNWSYLLQNLIPEDGPFEVIDGNTSGVVNMSFMYRGARVYRIVDDLDTSSVTNMAYMFGPYGSPNSYQQGGLRAAPRMDTSNVTDMTRMFYGQGQIESTPNYDTRKVQNMDGLFEGCSHLITAPNIDTSSATSMQRMFSDCEWLKNVPVYDTRNVQNMNYLFYKCTMLQTLPLIDMSSVIRMNYMCYMTPIKAIPALTPDVVEEMDYAFYHTTYVQSGALALYNRVKNMNPYHTSTFNSCGIGTTTGRAELDQIPSDWK